MKTALLGGWLFFSMIASAPGQAQRLPLPAPRLPLDGSSPPYAMNYTDQLAEKLGVKHGKLDIPLMDSGPNGLLPSLHGGVDRKGAMLKFQWRLDN